MANTFLDSLSITVAQLKEMVQTIRAAGQTVRANDLEKRYRDQMDRKDPSAQVKIRRGDGLVIMESTKLMELIETGTFGPPDHPTTVPRPVPTSRPLAWKGGVPVYQPTSSVAPRLIDPLIANGEHIDRALWETYTEYPHGRGVSFTDWHTVQLLFRERQKQPESGTQDRHTTPAPPPAQTPSFHQMISSVREAAVQDILKETDADKVCMRSTQAGRHYAITRRDIGTVIATTDVNPFDKYPHSMNDTVIHAFLVSVVRYANEKQSPTFPVHYTFDPAFFSTISRQRDLDKVRRWWEKQGLNRDSIQGVRSVMLPLLRGMHWSLVVVRPSIREIWTFDSVNADLVPQVRIIKQWLAHLLQESIEQWRVVSKPSPYQPNPSGCGPILCYNALVQALGRDPAPTTALTGNDLMGLRRWIIAALLEGDIREELLEKV